MGVLGFEFWVLGEQQLINFKKTIISVSYNWLTENS